MSNISPELEAMAEALVASGAYRVLRRLRPKVTSLPTMTDDLRLGIFLDLETTGLDTERDEIIEMAMVPFAFDREGALIGIGEPFEALREPSIPIPEEVTRLTGIDAETVAGKQIDPAEVAAFAEVAVVIVAHNAAFDRRFAERFCEVFRTKAWACSMSQVDWKAQGYDGRKLSHLAAAAGFFYDGHRAAEDCHAALEILGRPLSDGRPALAHMLTRARRSSIRIWAEDSPFELKERLKARGYRWNGEDGGPGPRAWYVNVDIAEVGAEMQFLTEHIYRRDVDLPKARITAFDRFSERD